MGITRTVAVALAAGLTALASATVAPAGAQAEPIVVEPSAGLVDGQTVTVTLNDPGQYVTQCDSEVGADPTLDEAIRFCGEQVVVTDSRRPAQVPYVVRSTFVSFGGRTIDCGAEPGDCVVSVAGVAASTFVSTPITIEPPVFTASPVHEALPDGAVLDVAVRGTPGDTITVAQCAAPVASTLASSRCGPHLDLVVGATGRATGELTVTVAVETGGAPLDCQVDACAVAAFDAAGALLREVPIALRRPVALTVGPAAGLHDNALVYADVSGYRDRPLVLFQCPAGVGPAEVGGSCTGLGVEVPEGSAPGGGPVNVRATYVSDDGQLVACDVEPRSCVIAVGAAGAPQWATAPITFARVTVTPSSVGLLDGQAITLSASGLLPDTAHRVVRCDPGRSSCEEEAGAPVVTSDADGTLSFGTTAEQRFTSSSRGRHEYCRDECTIELRPEVPFGWYVTVPYAMAAGEIAAAPDAGLADGDAVTLTGTDLMASYAGPPYWVFPSTGGWALGQCAAGVVDEPTIAGVFTHCAVAPPGVVDVAGSTAGVDVTVTSAFTSILGEEVDCTTGPDACVLVVTRLEQDGSVSLHATPVAFGAPAIS